MTSCASSSRRLRAVLLLVTLAMAAPTIAHAESASGFRQHYEAALRLYDSGQFEGAIKEFQAAYALKQLPRLLLNIGQAHRKLGHARDALGFYEFYLRVEPNPKPEIKAELTTYITQTRALLDAAERMRAQQDAAEPAPANEPQPKPQSPLDALNKPPPTGAVAAASPPSTAPPDRLMQTAPTPADTRATDRTGSTPVYKKWWFWTLIGVGVAGAATGIALGVRATASSDPANIEIRNIF